MAKHSQFVCQQCGYSQVGWAGKCPECGAWGSLVESLISSSKTSKSSKSESKKPIFLSSISSKKTKHLSTKIPELDRVLGGGLVPGQVVLLAGEPGIGKSTILLQLSQKLPNSLYISGEESIGQIKLRADRLGIKSKSLLILEETDVDAIIETVNHLSTPKPSLIIIDSIQTMFTQDLSGMSGSVGQVKECTSRLTKIAKNFSVPLILVGHVTKEGTVAGPATLSHMVDSVLWFEGNRELSLRILRSIKNRFGPTDEIGIFSMKVSGLEAANEESLFLTNLSKRVSGSAITCLLEGTRPILVEIQSLVVPTKSTFPRRIAQGLDSRRLEVVIAVLSRRCGLPLYENDIFVNVVGGITIKEPAADLAVALSLASSFYNRPLPGKSVYLGEVGLLGEIRAVSDEGKRYSFAKRHGFARAPHFPFVSQAITALSTKSVSSKNNPKRK
jgi:DNA repair protein RadA/Sms